MVPLTMTVLRNTTTERLANFNSLAATNKNIQASVDTFKAQLQLLMATTNECTSEEVGQRSDDRINMERNDEHVSRLLSAAPADTRNDP